jgi:methyl-accepting chemotaxis protein
MHGWLANITVARKLLLGFGLLLLMSVLMFWAGWSAIDSLSYRMDRMSAVNRLVDDFSRLRHALTVYVQGEGEPKAERALKDKVVEVRETLAGLSGYFAVGTHVQNIEDLTRHLADYEQGVGQLEAAYRRIEASRAVRRESGDRALGLLARLERAPGAASREQSIKALQMQFLFARFETRAYTYSGNPAHFAAAAGAVDKTLAALGPLRDAPGASDDTLPDELAGAIAAYRTSLDEHRSALAQAAKGQDGTTQHGDALMRICLALYDGQLQLTVEDTRNAAWRLLACLLLALVFGVASAMLITRQIVPPLREALRNVERIAQGDLTPGTPERRGDEIGQLADGLQRMTGSLRQLVGHIAGGAAQIAAATESLSTVTRQTQAGHREQALETDLVATAMQEMATSVQDVARNAVETASSVDQTASDASSGSRIVGQAIGQIETLAGEVELTAEAVANLAAQSGRISDMLDVIRTVAEQTNLLALNAAIEAARAGDAGRGFAVVADEVRGLAQRTQRSTEDIEVLVAALRHGTSEAVQRMGLSRELTRDSVGMARQVGQVLDGITRSIGGVQGMTQQIAAAAEQQGAVAEEINRSVVSVRGITEQAHAASAQTSQASQELATLGSALHAEVQRFRL